MSHHMGRWRLQDGNASRWVTGKVDLERTDDGIRRMRYVEGVAPFSSADADSERIY